MNLKLKSKLDQSVNWVRPFLKGAIETRYVRKKSPYIIGYVSSSIGCKLACKQCFLTQQKQTAMYAISPLMFKDQMKLIIDHYLESEEDKSATRINVNFMARGDAFVNKHIVNDYESVYNEINSEIQRAKLITKMNISTIMPYTIRDKKLIDIFKTKGDNTYLYYSLYSLDEKFRKIWMPNAIPWQLALDKLKEYQDNGGNIITFHWPFIKDQNDNIHDVEKMATKLKSYNFNAKFNLVRYNNHPNLPNKETPMDKLKILFDIVNNGLNNNKKSYIVPKVGEDVSASCGMFINDIEQ
jgi:23S rRNA (adenine2503-C2)-methyltransferase